MRPDLKSAAPAELTIEPLAHEGELLSASIRSKITSEIAACAHNEASNRAIYQLLKRVTRLGEIYAKATKSEGHDNKNENESDNAANNKIFNSFAQVDDELVDLICKQCFNDPAATVAFFQKALNSLTELPILGLTSNHGLPPAFKQLSYAGAVDSAAFKLLTSISNDSKAAALLSNVVLESALVRGSLVSALSTVDKLLDQVAASEGNPLKQDFTR